MIEKKTNIISSYATQINTHTLVLILVYKVFNDFPFRIIDFGPWNMLFMKPPEKCN